MKTGALLPVFALVLFLFPSCGTEQVAEAGTTPPPLTGCEDPFACASRTVLAETKPADLKDLHNLFHLSKNIVSGGEPLTDGALRTIAKMGVRTVLSVDGKSPNAALARELGMRYVHVPIRYGGMNQEQLLQITKTFREQPAPFYVHCFHGKHRGPAAAAVGRLVLDGVSRERALAEMRQWSGTAKKYPGLYATIATNKIPTVERTAAYAWDFPETNPIQGVRLGMVRMTRTFDNVRAIAKHGWRADAAHPDIDPLNEVTQLHQHFDQIAGLKETGKRKADYRKWMSETHTLTQDLMQILKNRSPLTDAARTEATGKLKAIKALCSACHTPYRNE